MVLSCRLQAPATLHLGKNPGIRCKKCWVGSRASVDDIGAEIIPLLLQGLEAETVQSIASRYTDLLYKVLRRDLYRHKKLVCCVLICQGVKRGLLHEENNICGSWEQGVQKNVWMKKPVRNRWLEKSA
jgi:hypothetical protein